MFKSKTVAWFCGLAAAFSFMLLCSKLPVKMVVPAYNATTISERSTVKLLLGEVHTVKLTLI